MGFIARALIGAAVGAAINSDSQVIMILCGIAFGIAFAWLMYKLYLIAVFISSFCNGFILTIGIKFAFWILTVSPDEIGNDPTEFFYILQKTISGYLITGLIVGLVCGIIGVLLVKPMIILSTSAGGSAVISLIPILCKLPTSAAVVVFFACFISGVYFQFKTTKKKNPAPNTPLPYPVRNQY